MKRLLISACLGLAFAGPVVAFDGFHLESVTTVKGKGEGWDYITLDSAKSALYIGHRSEGLQVFDLKTKK
jgi:hypothetical protein